MKYATVIIPIVTLSIVSAASNASTATKPKVVIEKAILVKMAKADLKHSMSAITLELFNTPTKVQKPPYGTLNNKDQNQEQPLGNYAD